MAATSTWCPLYAGRPELGVFQPAVGDVPNRRHRDEA